MTDFHAQFLKIFRPRIIGFAAAVFVLLAGCGQSGPLYLPEKTPAAEASAQAGSDAATGTAKPEAEEASKQSDDDGDDGR